MALYRDIEATEQEVENLRVAYLHRFGWQQTCNTPGSFWLWRRDFADVDAKRLEWWSKAKGPHGKPSKPLPFGVIWADLTLAVAMTLRELDPRTEDRDEVA